MSEIQDYVFPARAGMSPLSVRSSARSLGVPRASGDEPYGLNYGVSRF